MNSDKKEPAPIMESAEDATRQFVAFRLDGQRYCVDIMAVREIRMLGVLTAVPGAAADVCGVINLRGNLVPVYDLLISFGQGKTSLRSNHLMVVISVEGRLIAVLVDEVLDILTVASAGIEAIPEAGDGKRNLYFDGIVNVDQDMLIVLSLDKLFSRHGEEELRAIA